MKAARSTAVSALALLLLPLALYLKTVQFGFVYDDEVQITGNGLVIGENASLSLNAATRIWTAPTPPGNLFRPIPTLSYWLQSQISGANPAWFHLGNIFLHLIVTVLVFYLLLPLATGHTIAWLTALIFSIHPLHTETVANIVGRAEILSALFGLSTLLLARRYVTRAEGALLPFTFTGVSLFLALHSKESAYVFVVLIPLYLCILTKDSSPSPRAAAICALAGGVAILSLILRQHVLGEQFLIDNSSGKTWMENPIFHLPFSERFIPALIILGRYVLLILAPLRLSADYSAPPQGYLEVLYDCSGIFALLALTLFTMLPLRTPRFRFFSLWFLLSFGLTANLFTPIGTIMAERLAYLPSIGIIAICMAAMQGLAASSRTLYFLLIASVLFAFSLKTFTRLEVWRSNLTLFSATMEDNPVSPKALYNYGAVLYGEEKDYAAAKLYLRRALEMNPDHVPSARLMADIALAERNISELEHWYRYLRKLTPHDTRVEDGLEAIRKYREQPPS